MPLRCGGWLLRRADFPPLPRSSWTDYAPTLSAVTVPALPQEQLAEVVQYSADQA
ncbi:hypothetical protein [Microtetraspora malaysiensis]|uniref:hypothetical protein n=1 Tax=Microtetraspora malaysiensis TaxID=161358 RepID=UPI003D926302